MPSAGSSTELSTEPSAQQLSGSSGSSALSGRDRAVLRAVAAGRCQLGAGCQPVLMIDGLGCADSAVGQRLVVAGLLRRPDPTRPLGPAVLTPEGRAVLD